MQNYSEEIEYLQKKIDFFPYHLDEENNNNIDVFHDEIDGLPYVLLNNKRLYYKDEKREKIVAYIDGILREQSNDSPHKYTDSNFTVEEDSIIIDAGCAEGEFSLENIEKAKHIYLFESDADWNRILQKTFQPWNSKVTIVNKFVSDVDDKDNVTLSNYFRSIKNEKVFLKMDLEGYALRALKGSTELINRNDCKVACASYHYYNEANDILDFWKENNKDNYRVGTTKGVVFPWFFKDMKYPYFRKGIIRAEKKMYK